MYKYPKTQKQTYDKKTEKNEGDQFHEKRQTVKKQEVASNFDPVKEFINNNVKDVRKNLSRVGMSQRSRKGQLLEDGMMKAKRKSCLTLEFQNLKRRI